MSVGLEKIIIIIIIKAQEAKSKANFISRYDLINTDGAHKLCHKGGSFKIHNFDLGRVKQNVLVLFEQREKL